MARGRGRGRGGGAGGGGGGGAQRRKPQSGKQKKEYLKKKKEEREQRKLYELEQDELERAANMQLGTGVQEETEQEEGYEEDAEVMKPVFSKVGKDNKLTSLFVRESDEIVQERKNRGSDPLDMSKRQLGLRARRGINLGFPKRPVWDANTSAEELEQMEKKAFQEWLDSIHSKFSAQEVSPFEHNLEVWRQLWRTCEKSSVILVVSDVRNPLLHVPQALYDYVTQDLKVGLCICLTKTDLVSEEHVIEWVEYLQKQFPEATIVPFSTKAKGTDGQGADEKNGVATRRRLLASKSKLQDLAYVHEKSSLVLDTCLSMAKLNQQQQQLDEEDDALPTIGIVGHPNVGKSSLLNALIGEKVVSVSRTCGHTKHWQTHIIEKSGKPVAKLCDSPGLIFAISWEGEPAPRHVFECNGLYPIPQIRETFSAIRFIAEHVPLELVYNLTLDEEDYDSIWSPYAICGTFADKKGYTIQGGGPDFHRAGLEILRDTVDGLVLLCFKPPIWS